MRTHMQNPRGFTLIEMLVSVAIFATVMTIALGALLSMSESDRRAQTLKSVINNLNFSMDAMSRSIRTGTDYHCDASATPVSDPRDCAAAPAGSVAFKDAYGRRVIYQFETSNAALCGQPSGAVGCIVRSIDAGPYAPLTSSEVRITNLQFYVTGAQSATVQPHMVILLSGSVAVSPSQTSSFDLQTSVTQRLYDK